MEDDSTSHGGRQGLGTAAGESINWLGGVGFRPIRGARLWAMRVFLLAGFTIWGYLAIAPAGRIVPGHTEWHRTDFTVFTEAGAAFFDGRNPYAVANPRGWHYLYPPLFALLVAPLSLLDTSSQVGFWYAINVLLTFGCVVEAKRLCRIVGGPEYHGLLWIGAFAFLAMVLPFLDCMQAGQLGIAILYFLMLGCRLVLEGRSLVVGFLGGVTLSLPASIKLVPALPVVFLLFQQWAGVVFPDQRRRPLGRAVASSLGVVVGASLFLFAVPASIIGWDKNIHCLDVWQKQVVHNDRIGPQRNFNLHSYRNQSMANGIFLLSSSIVQVTDGKPAESHTGIGSSAGDVTTGDQRVVAATATDGSAAQAGRIGHPSIRIAIAGILIALAAVSAIVGRRANSLDGFTAFGLGCVATLLVSPLSWGHYFMAELPALLCVPVWLARRGLPRAARAAAVTPVVLSWVHYVAMPYAGGIGILGLGTAAWFLLVCGLMLWRAIAGARTTSAVYPWSLHHGLVASAGPHWVVRDGVGEESPWYAGEIGRR
jgi:hypothetical protein